MKFKQPKRTAEIQSVSEDGYIKRGTTTSVEDLINFLKQYPGDVPVTATWEGQDIPIYGAFITDYRVDKKGKPIISFMVDSDHDTLVDEDASYTEYLE